MSEFDCFAGIKPAKAPQEASWADFIAPEYRGQHPGDYEKRADGKIVRKDRWENAIRRIREALGDTRRDFEIEDVVQAVEAMANAFPCPEEEEEDFCQGWEWDGVEVKSIGVNHGKFISDCVVGDYVFCSLWSSCFPCWGWEVGYIEKITETGVHLDGHADTYGKDFCWPFTIRITQEQGERIKKYFPLLKNQPYDPRKIAWVFWGHLSNNGGGDE